MSSDYTLTDDPDFDLNLDITLDDDILDDYDLNKDDPEIDDNIGSLAFPTDSDILDEESNIETIPNSKTVKILPTPSDENIINTQESTQDTDTNDDFNIDNIDLSEVDNILSSDPKPLDYPKPKNPGSSIDDIDSIDIDNIDLSGIEIPDEDEYMDETDDTTSTSTDSLNVDISQMVTTATSSTSDSSSNTKSPPKLPQKRTDYSGQTPKQKPQKPSPVPHLKLGAISGFSPEEAAKSPKTPRTLLRLAEKAKRKSLFSRKFGLKAKKITNRVSHRSSVLLTNFQFSEDRASAYEISEKERALKWKDMCHSWQKEMNKLQAKELENVLVFDSNESFQRKLEKQRLKDSISHHQRVYVQQHEEDLEAAILKYHRPLFDDALTSTIQQVTADLEKKLLKNTEVRNELKAQWELANESKMEAVERKNNTLIQGMRMRTKDLKKNQAIKFKAMNAEAKAQAKTLRRLKSTLPASSPDSSSRKRTKSFSFRKSKAIIDPVNLDDSGSPVTESDYFSESSTQAIFKPEISNPQQSETEETSTTTPDPQFSTSLEEDGEEGDIPFSFSENSFKFDEPIESGSLGTDELKAHLGTNSENDSSNPDSPAYRNSLPRNTFDQNDDSGIDSTAAYNFSLPSTPEFSLGVDDINLTASSLGSSGSQHTLEKSEENSESGSGLKSRPSTSSLPRVTSANSRPTSQSLKPDSLSTDGSPEVEVAGDHI